MSPVQRTPHLHDFEISHDYEISTTQTKIKKITHIGTTDPNERAGGIPTFTWNLWQLFIDHFRDIDHEFSLSSDDPESVARDGRKVTVVAPLSGRPSLRAIRYLFWTLARSKTTDLYWVHGPRLGIWALLFFPRKCILHFHGPAAYEQFLENSSLLKFHLTHFIESFLYKRVKRIVCLSEAFKKKLVNLYGVDPQRVSVVPPVWELNAPPRQPEQSFTSDRPLRLITVRRLVKRTNVLSLVKAVHILLNEGLPVELSVVGAGPELEQIQHYVSSNQIGSSVHIHGHMPDAQLDATWRASDLFVLPTDDLEGFGMVILESYGKGVPVVGCNVDAIPKILSSVNKNCIIYGSDSESIADHLRDVVHGNTDVWMTKDWSCFSSSFSTESIREKYAQILRG